MATVPSYVGEFRKGDMLQVPIDHAEAAWAPGYFDIVDNQTQDLIITDQSVTVGNIGGVKWVSIQLIDDFDSDEARVYSFIEGRHYTILIKENVGEYDTDNSNQVLCTFSIAANPRAIFLGTVEKDDNFTFVVREENRNNLWYDVIDSSDGSQVVTNQPMTVLSFGNRLFRGTIVTTSVSYVIGRTYFIRLKDVQSDDPWLDTLYSFSVLPRLDWDLRRILGLLGENLVLDNFSYDGAGNIIGLRMRLFDSATNASNATQGVTDPEPGEIASYVVSQEHNVARNVRTFHVSVIDYESE